MRTRRGGDRSLASSRTTRSTSRRISTTRSEGPRPFALALGANLGEPRAALAAALARLSRRFGPLEVAPLYRTEPVSPIPQPEYLNTVALGVSELSAEELLAAALAVEVELGRRRDGRRDAPRTIDIDLLFVGGELRAGPGFELPHPRLRQRRFVLAPADLAPTCRCPRRRHPARVARLPRVGPWARPEARRCKASRAPPSWLQPGLGRYAHLPAPRRGRRGAAGPGPPRPCLRSACRPWPLRLAALNRIRRCLGLTGRRRFAAALDRGGDRRPGPADLLPLLGGDRLEPEWRLAGVRRAQTAVQTWGRAAGHHGAWFRPRGCCWRPPAPAAAPPPSSSPRRPDAGLV
jgi:2-amino-4-hydroxy-6-hydroxymethyldihydropteridine diphosphokinase